MYGYAPFLIMIGDIHRIFSWPPAAFFHGIASFLL
jgi:hypothetical protein